MIFNFLNDAAELAGDVVGAALGAPLAIVAETLEVPVAFVAAAVEAGCSTFDEVREWCRENCP